MLQRSWVRNWQALGATTDGVPLMQKLIAAYDEPQRKYHTLQHLSECLAAFERYQSLADHPHEVGIALWFHDAVYDVRADDNEARSAAWAEAALGAAAIDNRSVRRTKALIMATCHAAVPEDQDQKLLVDIDLAILGSPPDRFTEYEAQVREEYAWVPEPEFRQARQEVLRRFLSRSTIYNTPEFQGLLEAQARTNLARSIEQLCD